MSYTYTTSVGDGVTRSFPFSLAGQDKGYISPSNIVVFVAGVSVTNYQIRPASPNVVEFTSPPALGAEVLIRRVMPKSTPYADFSRGNPFSQETLNNTNLQMLYLLQEIYDGYLPEGFYFRVDIDMRGQKIVNLGAGTESGDAVNYDQWINHDERIVTLEDAIVSSDMTVRNLSVSTTTTEGQTSWTPGVTFTNALLFINGIAQNKLSGAFTITNNTINFPEPLRAGLNIYGLVGSGPTMPDEYLTQAELETLYFNLINQRLDSAEVNLTTLNGQVVTINGQLVTINSSITSLSSRVTTVESETQPIARGGTGATTADSALGNLGATEVGKSVIRATSAPVARTAIGAAASGANSDITSLSGLTTPLSAAQGGTGNTTGNAATATKLATARSLTVNLASTTAANFDGTINVNIGVSGALPTANGGTGSTTAAGARTNLGVNYTKTESSTEQSYQYDNGDLSTHQIVSAGTMGAGTSSAFTWTFPRAFAQLPFTSATLVTSQSTQVRIGIETISNTQITGFLLNSSSSSVTPVIHFYAFGQKA